MVSVVESVRISLAVVSWVCNRDNVEMLREFLGFSWTFLYKETVPRIGRFFYIPLHRSEVGKACFYINTEGQELGIDLHWVTSYLSIWNLYAHLCLR